MGWCCGSNRLNEPSPLLQSIANPLSDIIYVIRLSVWGCPASISGPNPFEPCENLVVNNVDKAIKDLQDTLVVISEIERRQSAIILEHSERIVRIDQRLDRVSEKLEGLTLKVDEIGDKLNGLIGFVAGQHPPAPPQ
jgi:hypothetical protein